MTRKLIMEKAKEFSENMNLVDMLEFNFSQGWLEHFKSKHGIKTYHHFGESEPVDMKLVGDQFAIHKR